MLCFPRRALARLTVFLALAGAACAAAPASSEDDWKMRDEILKRIKEPTIPSRDFVVTDYGALGDGTTDARPAIVKALEACANAGGGRVVIPKGKFLCNGPVHLKSNMNLHVAEGATLLFGKDAKDFLPVVLTRWEGIMVYNYSPLIYAYKQTNIAITGKGTIDGNGRDGMYNMVRVRDENGRARHEVSRQLLWKMAGGDKLPVEKRVFGEGHFLRPGGLEPVECTNVLIEDVTVTNMPFWTVHPTLCRNVILRNIRVDSTTGNNDGCDPDSCVDVLIEGCYFKTGDDGIAIKSGRDFDGWTVNRPTENVVVRNCTFAGRYYGLAIGSEMSGGVRNVFAEDCKAIAGRAAIYTKGNLDRGGVVEHVRVRRFTVENQTEAVIRFEGNYHGYRGPEKFPPQFRDFIIEDVVYKPNPATAPYVNNKGETVPYRVMAYGIYAEGHATHPVKDVLIRNVTIEGAQAPFWIKHIENFRLENVSINGRKVDGTPPLTPDDEKKLPIRD